MLVACWALRLGSFLFMRVLKAGNDSRFDELKDKPRARLLLRVKDFTSKAVKPIRLSVPEPCCFVGGLNETLRAPVSFLVYHATCFAQHNLPCLQTQPVMKCLASAVCTEILDIAILRAHNPLSVNILKQ